MKDIIAEIELAQNQLRERLESVAQNEGLTKEMYSRFLTVQYHLTKGVQRHFLTLAGHPATAKRRKLREFLINFAQEEEFHFEIARTDLKELGGTPGECPLDVKLWWLYFDQAIVDHPFMRLGATCILENISNGSAAVLDSMISKSNYLTPKALKFLTIHRHGPNLDHGNQIVEALEGAHLSPEELADVRRGAELGRVFYLRFMDWMRTGNESGEVKKAA